MAERFQEQQETVHLRVFESRLADLAQRQIGFDPDRDQAREGDALGRPARGERPDHAARMGGGEQPPASQTRLGEGRIGGEEQPVARIGVAKARRPEKPQTRGARRRDDLRLQRCARGARLGESGGEDGRDPHATLAAGDHRVPHLVGRGEDQGVLRRLRETGQVRPRRLALDRLAPRVDRIDVAGPAGASQIGERAPGGLARVVRGPHDGEASRRQQGPGPGGRRAHARRLAVSGAVGKGPRLARAATATRTGR